ncbi:ABC transporter permease [Alicyclobacillaceae bacterium I2511]|nr:ABC transporter permease [Alicyclobacillaceae bacterium I2511]
MRLASERFMDNKVALVSMIVLLLIILVSVGAPLLTHFNPNVQNLSNTDAPPSALHLLGTNSEGMDYLSRDLYGGQRDLLIGFSDTIIVLWIGIVLGGIAGYSGGWVDSLVMRVCDFMFNFPFLLLIIILSSIFNTTGVGLLITVIGLTGWPGVTRLIRGLFLNLRQAEFVLAAKMAGAGDLRIIFKHMIPNIMGTLVVTATFQMASIISAEAALSVIGFGVQPPTPTWGNVLSGALDYFTLRTEPWAWLPPALLITLTILCINFIGDGLRDAFDPISSASLKCLPGNSHLQ